MRKFRDTTCRSFDTKELNREVTARVRKASKKSATVATQPSSSETASNSKTASGKRIKTLNLNTYKDHSLGDYVEMIRQNGTVDSYSTETVSCSMLPIFLCLKT